jgi:Bax inhibitor 1
MFSHLRKQILVSSKNVIRRRFVQISNPNQPTSLTASFLRHAKINTKGSLLLSQQSMGKNMCRGSIVTAKITNYSNFHVVTGSGKRCFGAAALTQSSIQPDKLIRKRKDTYYHNSNSTNNIFELTMQNMVQVRHFSIDDRRKEREMRRRQRRGATYAEPEEVHRTQRGTLTRIDNDRGLRQKHRDEDRELYGGRYEERSQLDAMDSGQAAFLRKVYMYTGSTIGVASIGAFGGMLLPMSPLIPGLLALAPLFGLYMTDPNKTSPGKRLGLLGAFGFLSGMSAGPLIAMSLHMDPLILPMALLGSCAIFGGATMASLFAKEGSMLKLGAPLMGGMFALLGLSILSMFYPNPMLYNINLYGGLGLFTVFIAYDTHLAIEDYKQGQRDPLTHAASFFINFMAIFKRLLLIFMSRDD